MPAWLSRVRGDVNFSIFKVILSYDELFAKVISRQQKLQIVGKEYISYFVKYF